MVRFLNSNAPGLQKCLQKRPINDPKTPILKRWGLSIVIWEEVELWNASKQRFWSKKTAITKIWGQLDENEKILFEKFDSRKKFFQLSKRNKQNKILVSMCAGCKTYWKNLLKHVSLIINFFLKMGTLFEMFIWPFQKSFSLKKIELQSYYSLELVYFWKDLSILAKTKLDKKFKKNRKNLMRQKTILRQQK